MKIGVLGGTFDPVHLGHLIVAEYAKEKLNLGKVLFVPTAIPWLKQESDITDAFHRVKMLQLALRSNKKFGISEVDIERGGPSYTVDTVSALKNRYGDKEIIFLIGLDALKELPRWKNPDELIRMCRLVAMRRPGHDWELTILNEYVPGASRRIELLDVPLIEISSTDIRRKVAQGLSIRYLVPEAVEAYIRKNNLYC